MQRQKIGSLLTACGFRNKETTERKGIVKRQYRCLTSVRTGFEKIAVLGDGLCAFFLE